MPGIERAHFVMNQLPPEKLDWLSEAARRLEVRPQNYFARLDVDHLFDRKAPLELDIGCGEGALLVGLAKAHPERNYLGLERMRGRVHTVCRAAAKAQASNVRLLRIESLYAVKHLLPPNSVASAHLLFPDPWPKRYHHPRRLIQEEFLRSLHAALAPAGEFRVKTDDRPYFQWMEKVFAQVECLFERLDWLVDPAYPITAFEQKFISQGLPIYRARLRKV